MLNQAEPGAEEFNAEYFTEAWRAKAMPTPSRRAARWRGGTPSSSRRCSAERVIDMGCGPGALMFLLKRSA